MISELRTDEVQYADEGSTSLRLDTTADTPLKVQRNPMTNQTNTLPASFLRQFAKLNRVRTMDAQFASTLYDLYLFLFSQSQLPLRNKQMAFEAAADCKESWLVVAISAEALKHIHVTREAKGLRRAHPLQRIDRARHMFNRHTPMAKKELIKYFLENDTVALVPAVDNKCHGVTHWGRLIRVPPGHLMGGSFSKYATKADLQWVDQVIAKF